MTAPSTILAPPHLAIPTGSAIFRGFRQRCPHCGKGRLFRRFLKPVESCAACGESYGQIRADDFPPYVTILIVGHIVVPLMLVTDRAGFSLEAQLAIWVPVTLGLTLFLLQRVKGAVLGLMWSTERTAA
jgi:uncharacterized protein (DUF983 family)